MVAEAIEAEVEAFIASHEHIRDEAGRRLVIWNGYLPERTIRSEIVFFALRPSIGGEIDLAAYNAFIAYWDAHRNKPFNLQALTSSLIVVTPIAAGAGVVLAENSLGASDDDCRHFVRFGLRFSLYREAPGKTATTKVSMPRLGTRC